MKGTGQVQRSWGRKELDMFKEWKEQSRSGSGWAWEKGRAFQALSRDNTICFIL